MICILIVQEGDLPYRICGTPTGRTMDHIGTAPNGADADRAESSGGRCSPDGVDRLAATLIFAGWDRTSAMRRKVPLTKFATARPWHRALGDRSCSGGVPARRGRGHLLGRSRAGEMDGSGGHISPQEPGELPGNGRGDDALGVLAGGQGAKPARQALLRRPRARDDLRGQALLAAGDLDADPGPVLVGPGRL